MTHEKKDAGRMPALPGPVLGEMLPSDQVGMYMAFAYNLPALALPDDPSWVWQQLRFNPYIAMAVYEDIEEKDDKVGGDLDVRKENVLAKPRMVMPASDSRQDKQVAGFIEETLESYMGGSLVSGRLPFENVLWEALDAVAKGVAIGEIVYLNGSDRVFIQDVKFKPQHLFAFGAGPWGQYSTYAFPQVGPLRIRPGIVVEGLDVEQPLEDGHRKFFVHTFRSRQGNRWGMPVVRKVFWLSWFKRAGLRNWLRLLEKGPGTTMTRYSDGAAQAEKDLALQASQAISEEMAVAVPKKFEVEVLEHVRQNMTGLHREFVDDICNSGIARVILGQTLTSRGSDGGGSRALGEVHERVAAKKTEVDAKSLMLAVNTQLVWPLVLFNFGPIARPPVWGIKYELGADLKLYSDVYYRLWQMRLPLGKAHVYNTFQVPAPAGDEAILPPPTANDQNFAPPGGVEGEAGAY